MPTIIRFLTVLAILAGLAGAAMFYLANFVDPRPREMTVRIPSDQLDPVPILKPTPPAAAADPSEASGDEADEEPPAE